MRTTSSAAGSKNSCTAHEVLIGEGSHRPADGGHNPLLRDRAFLKTFFQVAYTFL